MDKPNKKDKKYYSDFIMMNGIQENKFVERRYVKDLEKYIKHLESKVNNVVLDDVIYCGCDNPKIDTMDYENFNCLNCNREIKN